MRRKLMVRSVWMLVAFLIASMPAWAQSLRNPAEVQTLVQGLLMGRTPPLQAGTIREVGQSYEVEVVTPGGSLVDRWLVDKVSGRIRSLYGQMLLSFQPGGGVWTKPLGWGSGTGTSMFDPMGMMAQMMGGFGGAGGPGGTVPPGAP